MSRDHMCKVTWIGDRGLCKLGKAVHYPSLGRLHPSQSKPQQSCRIRRIMLALRYISRNSARISLLAIGSEQREAGLLEAHRIAEDTHAKELRTSAISTFSSFILMRRRRMR